LAAAATRREDRARTDSLTPSPDELQSAIGAWARGKSFLKSTPRRRDGSPSTVPPSSSECSTAARARHARPSRPSRQARPINAKSAESSNRSGTCSFAAIRRRVELSRNEQQVSHIAGVRNFRAAKPIAPGPRPLRRHVHAGCCTSAVRRCRATNGRAAGTVFSLALRSTRFSISNDSKPARRRESTAATIDYDKIQRQDGDEQPEHVLVPHRSD